MANKTRISPKSLDYLETFKNENYELSTNAKALDKIIEEHKLFKHYENKLKLIFLHSSVVK